MLLSMTLKFAGPWVLNRKVIKPFSTPAYLLKRKRVIRVTITDKTVQKNCFPIPCPQKISGDFMEDRFIKFTLNIAKLNKLVQKLKTAGMKQFHLKGTHTLCIYQLLLHPDGMTSAELAAGCDLDPALVSRTLAALTENQVISRLGERGKYLAKYALTEKGTQVAKEIQTLIHTILETSNAGITPEELSTFYRVLDRLSENLSTLSPDFQ